LRERYSFRQSMLFIEVFRGLWHLPITCMGHNYDMGYPDFPIMGILSMIVLCMAASILLAWLRKRPRVSGLVLRHTAESMRP
jgi:hypothetical protein